MLSQIATFHDLRGLSVFITGGGNGIGAALTEGFLEQGARVAFVGRSDASAFADEMGEKHDNRPLFIACDITDTAALHAAMDRAADANGPLDVLVNNAANDQRHAPEAVTETIWDDMQAINLRAYFFACQRAGAMMKGRGGSIINFSSISYMLGSDNLTPYTTANAGIVGMTRSLARAWGPDRIRVNALSPGWVLTERQKQAWVTPEGLASHRERQCLKDMMEPRDVVGGVLFLASGLSRMMTAQNLVIDAGTVMTG